ncbi:MAG: chromophore lyase CpcT/CpeT [Hydrococcus sp. Prado102]|jgi:CpeT protein|nr:chromophore lyase CpcT/CpeT [Hydrococcus sp. Prado102]
MSDLMLTLARWIAGDFSNKKQADSDPKNYAHIRVFFRPLPVDFFGGIGFYSEQVYDHDLWSPYRQGIHRFVDRGDFIYVENYGLIDPICYAGAGRDLNILKTITRDRIQRRENCSMIFKKEGDILRGNVEGNCCFIERDGRQTYLISEVELTENTFVSWDRGMDVNTREQVWGSATGALKFEKRENFADEIPNVVVSNS